MSSPSSCRVKGSAESGLEGLLDHAYLFQNFYQGSFVILFFRETIKQALNSRAKTFQYSECLVRVSEMVC